MGRTCLRGENFLVCAENVIRVILGSIRGLLFPGSSSKPREAGNTYDIPRALAHAATKRNVVALEQPPDWEAPSILRPPEVPTEAELAAAEAQLKALQRHAFGIVDPRGG
jgi:hypothetical protein